MCVLAQIKEFRKTPRYKELLKSDYVLRIEMDEITPSIWRKVCLNRIN